jgi:hypothetical protein
MLSYATPGRMSRVERKMTHLRKPAFAPRRTIGNGQENSPEAAGEPLTCRLWLPLQMQFRWKA